MEKDHNTKSTAVGTDYAPWNQQTTKFSGWKKKKESTFLFKGVWKGVTFA